MKRKILCLSLVVVLLVAIFSVSAFAAYDDTLPLDDFTIYKGNQTTLHNGNEGVFKFNDVMKNYKYTSNGYVPNDSTLNGEMAAQLNSLQFVGSLPDDVHKLQFKVKIVDSSDIENFGDKYGVFIYNGDKTHEMKLKYGGDGSGYFPGTLEIGNGKTVEAISRKVTSLPNNTTSLPPYEYLFFNGVVDYTTGITKLSIEFASYLYEQIYTYQYEYETAFYSSSANPSIRINSYSSFNHHHLSCVIFDEIDISYSTLSSSIQSALNNAYIEAFDKGFDYGYSEQKKIIKEEVYNEAYNKGNTDGYNKGYDVGYDEGYEYCLDNDEHKIYQKGFDDGADAIRKDNINASAITRFFDGMLESTQGVMNTFFSLDIGGVTVGWIIGILISAVVIFIALKIFIRG